ncbi:MAG TPA: hypothetical protein VE544_13330 [Nitrososphaeraceae archaeon]|jgi:hypothetical protein|nr:hypothetical protein [Nitrososphaeraceae archaeon]
MNANRNNDSLEKRQAPEIRTRISTTELTLATKPTATKSFKTFDGMTEWLNNPMTAKLYKVGKIDWVANTVKVEAKPIPWYEQCREMGWSLD